MASPWPTYTLDSLPTHDLKSPSPELDAPATEMALAFTPPVRNNNPANGDQSDLAHSLHTTPPTLVKPDAALRVVPFTAIDGSRTETISKTVPMVVSMTSVRVKFQEASAPTLPPIKDGIPVTSGVRANVRTLHHDADPSTQQSPASERADVAAAYPTNVTLSTREQVSGYSVEHVVTSAESSWMPEQYVATSSPTTDSHAVAPTSISAAANVTPPPLSTQPNRMSTAISEVSSPSMGASQSPTITLAQTPVLDRDRPNGRPPPKRSVTDSTAGSISIVQSKYTDMVFENVPRLDNILAWLFTWLLLAGFVVLPSTFSTLEEIPINSSGFQKVLHSIQHLPILVIAYSCCGIGGIGMCFLWLRWSHNYVWLLNSVFIPGLLNGISGLLSTFAGIYGVQKGVYGTSSIVTLAVTGGCTLICGFLTAIYSFWKLRGVKRLHSRELEQARNGGEIGEKRLV